MPERPIPGRSSVSRRAITDIIRAAVLGSYGVAGFADRDPRDRLARFLGMAEPGIRIGSADNLHIDLRLNVAHGLPVAEVARQVDSAVRYALNRALDRDVAQVTIHIDGLRLQPGRPPESTSAAPVGPPVRGPSANGDGPSPRSRSASRPEASPGRPGRTRRAPAVDDR